MTTPPRTMSHVTVLLLLCLGALLAVGSCGVPLPTERDADPRRSVVDPSDGNVVITVDVGGRVTLEGEPIAMEDVSVRLAEIAAAEPVPVVTSIRAAGDVPYRYVEALQRQLVEANAIRVVFETVDAPSAESASGLRLVLPERGARLGVSGRNVLHLAVQASGEVYARRGESPEVQPMTSRSIEGLWRQEVSRNPILIASISTQEGTQYRHVLAVLGALNEARAQRISLLGADAP